MTASGLTILTVVSAKRVREPKFVEFGTALKKWRGDRDIEEIVRKVRDLGVEFDGATLRGWEYGWTGQPDPIRLLALASVYSKTSTDVFRVLASARNVRLPRDLASHTGEGKSNLHATTEAISDTTATRIRELETRVQTLEVYRSVVERLRPVLADALTLVGQQSDQAAAAPAARRGRPRKVD